MPYIIYISYIPNVIFKIIDFKIQELCIINSKVKCMENDVK